MPGLADSRWARSVRFQSHPGPPRPQGPQGSQSSQNYPTPPNAPQDTSGAGRRHELGRYTRIVRRLKWKLPFLAEGYNQAVAREVDPGKAAEAELMFKLDFFEFYMLIERATVHLLGVFGVEVSREFAPRHLQALAEGQPQFAHRYHANVLEALDDPDNPLHAALGTGDARRQLARAKDLRNRWKNAEDTDAAGGPPAQGKFVPGPLESYDLERMLTDIFDGFDRAYLMADMFVAGIKDVDMPSNTQEPGPGISEEEEWGFMVDAMDWEAV